VSLVEGDFAHARGLPDKCNGSVLCG